MWADQALIAALADVNPRRDGRDCGCRSPRTRCCADIVTCCAVGGEPSPRETFRSACHPTRHPPSGPPSTVWEILTRAGVDPADPHSGDHHQPDRSMGPQQARNPLMDLDSHAEMIKFLVRDQQVYQEIGCDSTRGPADCSRGGDAGRGYLSVARGLAAVARPVGEIPGCRCPLPM
jgi:hypothetical protein